MINPYATHISDAPHPSLSPVVADRYGEVLVQYAADCVRVKSAGVGIYTRLREGRVTPCSPTEGFAHYLREAFTREYTREA
jgi:hypothetical protein